ncbi:unnamed protein product, partial [Pylaiella littoralis]
VRSEGGSQPTSIRGPRSRRGLKTIPLWKFTPSSVWVCGVCDRFLYRLIDPVGTVQRTRTEEVQIQRFFGEILEFELADTAKKKAFGAPPPSYHHGSPAPQSN